MPALRDGRRRPERAIRRPGLSRPAVAGRADADRRPVLRGRGGGDLGVRRPDPAADLPLRARAPDGVTASEVAEQFALHSNVARHHLDKLTAGRLPRGVRQPLRPAAGRAGRRSGTASPRRTPGWSRPGRGDDLLVMLLGRGPGPDPSGRGRGDGRGSRRGLRPPAGRPDVGRRRAPVVPSGPARHRRRPDRPRFRGPRRGAGWLAGADQGRLPLLRHRQAAPGDLRGGPGHGPGHAVAACTARR